MRGTFVQLVLIFAILLMANVASANDQQLTDFEKEVLADFQEDIQKADVVRLDQEARARMQILIDSKDGKNQESKSDDLAITVRYVKR